MTDAERIAELERQLAAETEHAETMTHAANELRDAQIEEHEECMRRGEQVAACREALRKHHEWQQHEHEFLDYADSQLSEDTKRALSGEPAAQAQPKEPLEISPDENDTLLTECQHLPAGSRAIIGRVLNYAGWCGATLEGDRGPSPLPAEVVRMVEAVGAALSNWMGGVPATYKQSAELREAYNSLSAGWRE